MSYNGYDHNRRVRGSERIGERNRKPMGILDTSRSDRPRTATVVPLAAPLAAPSSWQGQRGRRPLRRWRRAADPWLREGSAFYRALSERASDMVVVVDARGAMRYVSPSHRRVLGHAPETLHGRMTLDYTHPDDVTRVRASFAACLRAPSTPVPVDLRLRHADGSWRTVESIMDNRLDDPAVGGVIVTSRDITDRTRAEESLRLSEARYRALSEHASDIVAILGPDGTMRYASPSHHRILGYRPEEIVGSSVLEWTHPDDRVRARDAIAACLRQPGGTSTVESRLRHADGRWVTLESIADNRLDDPAIGGIVVTSRDVTARAGRRGVARARGAPAHRRHQRADYPLRPRPRRRLHHVRGYGAGCPRSGAGRHRGPLRL